MSKNILIIAGEASGDLYGAHLASALKKRFPDAKFSGVGGAKMKEAGVEILHPIDSLAIIGVSEIFSRLKIIKNLFQLLKDTLDKERFDLAILVNYPGFNLRFAKSLKEKNIPVVFYSSPQVWAWGRWRIKEIKTLVDKMIVFLKLEEEFYKREGVRAEFVGHPLVDIVRVSGNDLGVKKDAHIISLVPGSRRSEIKNIFPTMVKAASIIYKNNKDVRFIVTKHPEIRSALYDAHLKRCNVPLTIIDGRIYDCLNISDLGIVASGSVTLEAAILNLPMVIIYRVSFITALLFLIFAKINNIGLVNIIAGRKIVPELLQYRATPGNIAKEALDILSNEDRYRKMKKDIEEVSVLLGPPGASERASEIISEMLK